MKIKQSILSILLMVALTFIGCGGAATTDTTTPGGSNNFTVTYNSDGGSAITAQTVTYPATTVVTLPVAPTKTGCSFLGWYTAIGGIGTEFTASTSVTADITVYAKWSGWNVFFTDNFQRTTLGTTDWDAGSTAAIDSTGSYLVGYGNAGPSAQKAISKLDLSAVAKIRIEYEIKVNDLNSWNFFIFTNSAGNGYLIFFDHAGGVWKHYIMSWDGTTLSSPAVPTDGLPGAISLSTTYLVRIEYTKATGAFTFSILDAVTKASLSDGSSTDTTYTGLKTATIGLGNTTPTATFTDVKNPLIDSVTFSAFY